MLRKITIKHKIYCLAIMGAVLAWVTAGGSIYSINQVGVQLKKIAEEHIPLTEAVTSITVLQLEQAVSFERSVRYAEIMAHNASARSHYKKNKHHFEELAHKVDAKIIETEKQIAHVIQIESEAGGSKDLVEEFTHILNALKKIEKNHASFDKHVLQVFSLFDNNRTAQAERLAEQVSAEEDKLDHELESLLHELEDFTQNAALHAEHLEQKLIKILIISSLVLTLLFVTAAILIMRGIIPPLLATQHYAQELSKGNLEAVPPQHWFKDEIAGMIKALIVFKNNAVETNALKAQQEENALLAEEEKKEAMREMADNFDSQVGGLVSSLASASTELQSTAESMKNIADETQRSGQTVANSSEMSSMNVNTVASAMEEMSATSSEIALQITAASVKSTDTSKNATIANETVGNLNTLVENIGEVVVAIQNIAEQTNLLALNATIEAARAGDAGKGFAVVADEVKKLANETGQKTEEIGSQISAIQDATRESVEAMQRIISNISEIDDSVTGVSAAVEEQNATTSEITRSISEASQGAQQVSQIIVEVQKGAQETGSSADAVLEAAQEVSKLSETLQGSVREFLQTVRSDNKTNAPSDTVESSNDDGSPGAGLVVDAAE